MSLRIVGGLLKGRPLKSPKGDQTRPTTSLLREALFNICQARIEKARFLDLFAGSGAMGFEAISRGASFVTFIEKAPLALRALRDNAALLQVEPQVQILGVDAKVGLSALLSPYDLIYIDPPYGKGVSGHLELIVSRRLLAPGGLLFVEGRHDPRAVEPVAAPSELVHLGQRRYGIARLDEYTVN